jgi:putative Mg2+ transporter-C (MgtC) family protein
MNQVAPLDIFVRLAIAALLGASTGLEREYRHKPAGLRTNILIALGSALFALVSIQFAGSGGSSDRVAAQIVTGVGFLGAGAIMRSGAQVRGLTTAASIWVNAGIGMAAGAGLFVVAIGGAVFTLAVLTLVGIVEERFDRVAAGDPETSHGQEKDREFP